MRRWWPRYLLTPMVLALVFAAACSDDDEAASGEASPTTTATIAASESIVRTATTSATSTPAATSSTATVTAVAATGTAAAAAAPADCRMTAPLTVAQTEGPYYRQGSPERTSLLEPGMAGTKLVVTGYVLTPDCRPVARAWVDFWQADAQGAYDNAGYRLRGHQFTDAEGRFRLETVVPGEYPGRTPHIHVKVQAPNGPVLTSQVYFPAAASANQRDGIFNAALLLKDVRASGDSATGRFDFVVNASR